MPFILTFYRDSYLFIFGKISLDYFGRIIANLLGGLVKKNVSNTSDIKSTLPQDSHGMLSQPIEIHRRCFGFNKNINFGLF